MSLEAKLDAWSDYLNPMLIKELRQIFSNSAVIYGSLGLLIGNLVVFAWQLRNMTDVTTAYGPTFLRVSLWLLTGIASLSFGISFGWRYAAEVKSDAMKLIWLTSMDGKRLLHGKMLAALLGGILLLSMCLPSLFLSFFMRGVTLWDVLGGVLAYLFCFLFVTLCSILLGGTRNWLVRCGLIWLLLQFVPIMAVSLFFVPPLAVLIIGIAGLVIPYMILLAMIK